MAADRQGARSAALTLDQMLHYPFPLSTGQVAILALPKALDADDAERLAAFVLALATGDE